MSTAFSKVVDAFVAALSAATAVSASITKARTAVVSDDELDAVNVYWEGSQPTRGAIKGAPVDWQSKISVECYARSTTETGDVAVDALLKKVYERLAQDTSLGGAVADIGEPFPDPSFDGQGQRTGLVKLTYIVEHRTSSLTLD